MAKLFDRVGQATATTGTGTVTLGVVITDATNGDLATFTDMGAVAGDNVNYLIVDGNNWEIGTGALGGTGPGFTLTRTVFKSKISGTVGITALTLSGGAKVYSVPASGLPNQWGGAIRTPNLGYNVLMFDMSGIGGVGTNGTTVYLMDAGFNRTIGVSSSSIDFNAGAVQANTEGNHIFAFRSGTNAQTFRVYGSTDTAGSSPTNYSRLSISHAGGTSGATIATEAGGTGTAGPLTFKGDGTTSLALDNGNGVSLQYNSGAKIFLGGDVNLYQGGNMALFLTGSGARIGIRNDALITWTATGANATPDTALARNAAGVIEINNGTTGTFADLTLRNIIGTGGFSCNLVTKTAAYTATANYCVILADATSGAVTITLPTAVGRKGQEYSIKKIDSSANAVTVATTSSQTIDGSTTKSLATQYSKTSVVSDGANWFILV